MALPFFVSDLRELLEDLPLVRRQAVLYALHAGLDLRRTVDLRWGRPMPGADHPICRAIIDTRQRHHKLDYLFWETLPTGVVAPLFGIHDSVWDASGGWTFAQIKAQFARMTWLDPQAERSAFFAALNIALDPVASPIPGGA